MSKIKLSKDFIRNTVKRALNEDLYPSGDITSNLVKNNKVIKVKLLSNQDAIIGGLRSRALIRISFNDKNPRETERFSWSKRVRDLEVCKNGFIWVIEDGDEARLIKFSNSAEN